MHKLADYLEHARQCWEMARTAPPEQKSKIQDMARAWEQLAAARRRKLDQLGIPPDQDTGRELPDV